MKQQKMVRVVFILFLFCLFSFFYFVILIPNKKVAEHRIDLRRSFDSKISLEEFLLFCRQNSSLVYQDIIMRGKTLFQGINICDNRYSIIKPILDGFQEKPFSVLDVGAAQGYFSFRIANDFPRSNCVMIEHSNKDYDHHGFMLYQLCQLNDLPNITYFHKEISIPTLENLSHEEHFDVILALLVVHQIDDSMEIRKKVLETLFDLGDNVILEVSNDVAPELRDYVREELCKSEELDYSFLGEVDRYYNPATAYGGQFPNGKGEFYWFRKKNHKLSNTHVK